MPWSALLILVCFIAKNPLPNWQGILVLNYFVCLEVNSASFAFTLLLVPNITK